MLQSVFGETVPEDKEGRERFLLSHKIAVWDMVKECETAGSADSSLKNLTRENINDIPELIKSAGIRKILCNGGKSHTLFKRYFKKEVDIPYYKMPSTSPANFKFDMEKWRSAFTNE